jgi:hypothetical protein
VHEVQAVGEVAVNLVDEVRDGIGDVADVTRGADVKHWSGHLRVDLFRKMMIGFLMMLLDYVEMGKNERRVHFIEQCDEQE